MRSLGALAVAVALTFGMAGCRPHTAVSSTTSGNVDKAISFTGSHNLVWVQGKHYRLVTAATPPLQEDTNVEVLEFFEYGCGHCYVLEPWVVAWERTKPAFIRFTRVPVTYKPDFIPHAQLFYTLKELGRVNVTDAMDLHHEVFDTIHRMGQMLLVYGDPAKSEALQVDFAGRFGIPPGVFEATYRSDRVAKDLREAGDVADTYQIQGTPTFVVGKRYLTDAGSAGGGEHLIVLLTDLARQAKSAR